MIDSQYTGVRHSELTKTLYGFTIQDFYPDLVSSTCIPKDIANELRFDKVEKCFLDLNIESNDKLFKLTASITSILKELYSYGRCSKINYQVIEERISESFESLAYVQCIQRKSGKTSAFCTKLVRDCFAENNYIDLIEAYKACRDMKALNKAQYLAKSLLMALCDGSLDLVSIILCDLKDLTLDINNFKKMTNRFYRDGNDILVNYKYN